MPNETPTPLLAEAARQRKGLLAKIIANVHTMQLGIAERNIKTLRSKAEWCDDATYEALGYILACVQSKETLAISGAFRELNRLQGEVRLEITALELEADKPKAAARQIKRKTETMPRTDWKTLNELLHADQELYRLQNRYALYAQVVTHLSEGARNEALEALKLLRNAGALAYEPDKETREFLQTIIDAVRGVKSDPPNSVTRLIALRDKTLGRLERLQALKDNGKSKLDEALEHHVESNGATPTEIKAALQGERARRGQYVAAIELLRNGACGDAIEVLQELRGERGGALDARRRNVLAAIIQRVRNVGDNTHRTPDLLQVVVTKLETMRDGVGNEIKRLEKLERFATAHSDPANLETPTESTEPITPRAALFYLASAFRAANVVVLMLCASAFRAANVVVLMLCAIALPVWLGVNAVTSLRYETISNYWATLYYPAAFLSLGFAAFINLVVAKTLLTATQPTPRNFDEFYMQSQAKVIQETYEKYKRDVEAREHTNTNVKPQ